MSATGQYQVYLSRWIPDAEGSPAHWEDYIEMEDAFPGLRYKSCEGIETQGTPKYYLEEFPESSTPKAFITENVETNSIEFQLVFKDIPAQGSSAEVSRFTTYQSFLDHIRGYRFKFYDSERKIKRDMFLSGEVTVSESKFYGGTKYFIAKFPCTALNTPNLT